MTDASDVHILGVGTALPGAPVDNPTLAARLGLDTYWGQWIDHFVGTDTRHMSVDLDSGEVVSTLADLGETAARLALAAAGLGPDAVDLIVMGTATPDKLMPTTVNVVADRLGIDGVPTFQLQSGCTGAFQALAVASRLLVAGGPRTALVLGGDVGTKVFDYGADFSRLPPRELINYMLFGDGAGAAVLSVDPTPAAVTIRQVSTRLTGLGRAPGQSLDWFGARPPGPDSPTVAEDYKAIEELVPVMSEEILAELLADVGWKPGDVDYVLPPQLSGRMTTQIMERLALPGAQEVSCVRRTGNTGNATPFFQLERILDRMTSGDRAVGVSVESSKWIRAGFAVEKA
ncbi:3-oxoacyl-[acyl-carrier-protein] synthase-3 [Parafrankia irregularis]|uniref:3-oxoacyl-[acyl-carrier-protein] synthase-3 n=1 Tax=Parafrankia irregularis TaxID=795642 RepID=A0A0S4QSF1_9ACTN|nr:MULTISPECIES: 3-oxoacyl-ACP synthase III family protein [Parafrankia]MBE3205827.1 3-oxoacyl-ACP synthase III family protein [Parafrankia sp. CH37]CUU58228.1 3-oxoacyl-[acyl-carrier-protein] synthase-3 [Parafrankia irregularis]